MSRRTEESRIVTGAEPGGADLYVNLNYASNKNYTLNGIKIYDILEQT